MNPNNRLYKLRERVSTTVLEVGLDDVADVAVVIYLKTGESVVVQATPAAVLLMDDFTDSLFPGVGFMPSSENK